MKRIVLVLSAVIALLPLAAQNRKARNNDPVEQFDTLAVATVSADRSLHPVNRTQTGLTTLDSEIFRRGYAFLSSPDLIKMLQMLPGVSGGTELSSGLYVHGGIGSDNLYQLDGVPMYQVSHLGGMFSSFNTDMIRQVDFYKSGFPARYGGRMSSVVDVKTEDGDFNEYHGVFALGSIDGRLQYQGPIGKDGRTSFNLGLRRSWLDCLTVPAIAYANWRANRNAMADNPNGKYESRQQFRARYGFWDSNARVTHKFNEDNRLSLNLYMGRDVLPLGVKETMTEKANRQNVEIFDIGLDVRWGNLLGSLNWDVRLGDGLTMNLVGYYSGYKGLASANTLMESRKNGIIEHTSESYANISRVDDLGVKADFDWIPDEMNHVRFGGGWISHRYGPSRSMELRMETTGTAPVRQDTSNGSTLLGQEPSAYAEDEIALGPMIVNVGFRAVAYMTAGKTYVKAEPRVAMMLSAGPAVDVKASYARMNQFNHLVASMYLDLPGNLWMPSTAHVQPMMSDQFAAGVYIRPGQSWNVNVEGWYKTMHDLYEYAGAASLYPPIDQWETSFVAGQGRSYGAELEASWSDADTELSAAYTLSWSQRYFEDFYAWWYPDRFDNRHKITLSASRRLGRKADMYASWNYHIGNRTTVATQVFDVRYNGDGLPSYYIGAIYDSPNNLQMPAYHRIDIGLNIHRRTRRGNEGIWNISAYNAYCRMNPFFANVDSGLQDKEEVDQNHVRPLGTAYGLIPIIPSFSYTVRF